LSFFPLFSDLARCVRCQRNTRFQPVLFLGFSSAYRSPFLQFRGPICHFFPFQRLPPSSFLLLRKHRPEVFLCSKFVHRNFPSGTTLEILAIIVALPHERVFFRSVFGQKKLSTYSASRTPFLLQLFARQDPADLPFRITVPLFKRPLCCASPPFKL